VLLTDESLFTSEEVLASRGTYYARKSRESARKQRIRRRLPSLATDRSRAVVDGILNAEAAPATLGLVLGGGERVGSMEERVPGTRWLVSDVDLSYGPGIVADATALPLADGRFDAVVAEMVLEHVVDPFRAAAEMQRVCKQGGLIVVTVPFCFPWHGIPLDFYRCTPSGLRALCDWTELVHLGPAQGPAGALAYLADGLLVNSSSRRFVRMGLAALSRFAFGWLKSLDRLGVERPGAVVSSGSLTYVGRKTATRLTRARLRAELDALPH
jgi:SAM-dependent methyltransferase